MQKNESFSCVMEDVKILLNKNRKSSSLGIEVHMTPLTSLWENIGIKSERFKADSAAALFESN